MTSGEGAPARADMPDWHQRLRRTFHAVGRGRVEPEVLDDVVQDALAIVYEKGFASGVGVPTGPPPLAWCLAVLRNVIGNHYRKRRRRDVVSGVSGSGIGEIERLAHGARPLTPLEVLEHDEVRQAVDDALADLRTQDGGCAGYLARIAAGTKPVRLAEDEGIAASIMYRRLHRCRQKLARLLENRGITP